MPSSSRRERAAILVATAVVACLAAAPAWSQTKSGTAIGQFLRIETSARHAGMGNAGSAVVQGIESVYFNPGAIGLLDRPSVEFTRGVWFADIHFDYAAVAFPASDWGNLFFSVTSLNSGNIDVRTVDQPLGTGERYTVGDVAVSVGFGRAITDRLAGGGTVTFAEERAL